LAVTHFSDDPEDEPLTRRLLLELKEEMGASAREYRGALAKLRGRARIRTKEAENLLGYIQRVVPEGSPCLLLGDLNAEVGSPELSMILDSGFQDTYPMVNDDPGYTWDPVANPLIEAHHIRKVSPADLLGCLRARLSARRRRIDYILFRGTRPDCPVVESSLCANSPLDGTYASDHFGVMTTFRFS
jgi:endonuclease/exonuclease/phosphatase family metal-dependent hydrolase